MDFYPSGRGQIRITIHSHRCEKLKSMKPNSKSSKSYQCTICLEVLGCNAVWSAESQPTFVTLVAYFHVGFLLGLFFDSEDGSYMFLRNVGRLPTVYMALYPMRQNTSQPPLWELQILLEVEWISTEVHYIGLQWEASNLNEQYFKIQLPPRRKNTAPKLQRHVGRCCSRKA
jgi:hypothetical protein